MNLDRLIWKLEGEGIYAQKVFADKNGVPFTGICVSAEKGTLIRPVIYVDDNMTEEDIIAEAKKLIGLPELKADEVLECVTSREYILANVNLAILREVEDAVYLPYLGQKLCMKLHVDLPVAEGSGSITVTEALLKGAGLSFEEALFHASRNTEPRLTVDTVANALGLGEEAPFGGDFFIFSTTDKIGGAVALAFKRVFRKLCEEHGFESLMLLPSSTEEVLGLPFTDDMDPVTALEMVKDINENCVDPKLWLNPAVYQYNLATDTINVVAGGGEAYDCVQ